MSVTLFAGDQDIIFHMDQAGKRLERLVPEAKINIIPGAGHALIHLTEEILHSLETK